MTIGGRHRSLNDEVCEELRRRIISWELPPGTRLVEDALATELGVSRNPLREALRTLATEGFVRTEPRKGAVVARISPRDLVDLFDVRESLDVLAARTAAARVTPDHARRLVHALATATAAEDARDLHALTTANTELHLAVIDCAGNEVLRTLYLTVHQRLQWVFREHAGTRGAPSAEEHRRIVEAVLAGDVEAAGVAAAEHVDAGRSVRHLAPTAPGAGA